MASPYKVSQEPEIHKHNGDFPYPLARNPYIFNFPKSATQENMLKQFEYFISKLTTKKFESFIYSYIRLPKVVWNITLAKSAVSRKCQVYLSWCTDVFTIIYLSVELWSIFCETTECCLWGLLINHCKRKIRVRNIQ